MREVREKRRRTEVDEGLLHYPVPKVREQRLCEDLAGVKRTKGDSTECEGDSTECVDHQSTSRHLVKD